MRAPANGHETVEPPDQHWDEVYHRVGASHLSWYQSDPAVSVELIDALGLAFDAAIIDVGGGASTLVDSLVGRGYSDVSVLDVSGAALRVTRQRLGPAAGSVGLLQADLLKWHPRRGYHVWHDRAVFHFLVEESDQERYRQTLRAALDPGGFAIVASFAPDGPERCSGLAVARYGVDELVERLGAGYDVIQTRRELHTTPSGARQPFTWVALRSTSGHGT